MFAFIAVELLVHVFEEIFNFPGWATNHFGTTTLEWYILSHLIIIPLGIFISLKAARSKKQSTWIFLAVGLQTIIFTNGLFHLITTFLFKEYSPGIISSLLVTFPFSLFFYKHIVTKQLLTLQDFTRAVVLGGFMSILVVASLFLDMNTHI